MPKDILRELLILLYGKFVPKTGAFVSLGHDCISSSGVGNLVFIDENTTGEIDRDILQRNLFESVKELNLGRNWVLQHVNDPKHRAHLVTKWLDEKEVERHRSL